MSAIRSLKVVRDSSVKDANPLLDLGLDKTGRGIILVVGDGDLSYAATLMRHVSESGMSEIRVLGTTLEGRDELFAEYPFAAQNVETLQEYARHEFDATKMDILLANEFEGADILRIVWNFPHYSMPVPEGDSKVKRSRKRNFIHKHRELLESFFASASKLIAQRPDADTRLYVTLCGGQGGTPLDPEPHRVYGDTWQVVDLAARSGFTLRDVFSSDDACANLARVGYKQKGYRQGDRSFSIKNPVTHVFGKPKPNGGAKAAWAVCWRHDIAFWINPETFSQARFEEILAETAGGDIDIVVGLLDQYTSKEGKQARTFSMAMSSRTVAFSKWDARDLALSIRDAIDGYVDLR